MDRHVRWLRRRIIASVASQTAETFALVAVIAFALLQWRTDEGPLSSLFAAVVIGQLVAFIRVGYALRNNPLNYVFMRKYVERPFGYTVSRFHDEDEAHPAGEQLPGFVAVATIRDANADPEPVFDIFHDPSLLVAASVSRASGAVALVSSLEDGRLLVTDARAMPPHERLVINVAEDDSLRSIIAAHQKAISKRVDISPLATSAHQAVLDSLMYEYDSYLAIGPMLSPFLNLEFNNRSWLRLSARIKRDELHELPVRLGPDLPFGKTATRTAVPAPAVRPPTPVDLPQFSVPVGAAPDVDAPIVEAPVVVAPVIEAPDMAEVHMAAVNMAAVNPGEMNPSDAHLADVDLVGAKVLGLDLSTPPVVQDATASLPVVPESVAAVVDFDKASLADVTPVELTSVDFAPTDPSGSDTRSADPLVGSVFEASTLHRPSVAPVSDDVAALVVAPPRLELRTAFEDNTEPDLAPHRARVTTEVPMVVVSPFEDPTAPSRMPEITGSALPVDAAAIAEADLVAATPGAETPGAATPEPEPAPPAAPSVPKAASHGVAFDPAAAAERMFFEHVTANPPIKQLSSGPAPTETPAATPEGTPAAGTGPASITSAAIRPMFVGAQPATLAEAITDAPDNAAELTDSLPGPALHDQAPMLAYALAAVDVHSPERPLLSAAMRSDSRVAGSQQAPDGVEHESR